MLWSKQPQPGGDPLPDLHPAQIELLDTQRRIAACSDEIDAQLRGAGNNRPTMRDALLDLRLHLRAGTL